MRIDVRKRRKACVFECSGDLTLGGGELLLRRTLGERLEAGEQRFVFDLTQLRYMDSAGVGEIVGCSKRALDRNGVIKIVLPEKGTVRRVFEVTGLEKAFEIFTDPTEAVATFWD